MESMESKDQCLDAMNSLSSDNILEAFETERDEIHEYSEVEVKSSNELDSSNLPESASNATQSKSSNSLKAKKNKSVKSKETHHRALSKGDLLHRGNDRKRIPAKQALSQRSYPTTKRSLDLHTSKNVDKPGGIPSIQVEAVKVDAVATPPT